MLNEYNNKTYKEIDDLYKKELIVPYEMNILDGLSNNTNKNNKNMINYLDSLCSYNSIGYSSLYSKYLLLFLDKDNYNIYRGNLKGLDNKNIHYWIQNDEFVYDTTFIGKWPNDLFQNVLFPDNITKLDLERDKEYNLILNSNTFSKSNKCDELGYFDWYNYNKNNVLGIHSYYETLKIKKYPSFIKKREELFNFIRIYYQSITDYEFPYELLDEKLYDFISNCGLNYDCKDNYMLLINFIVNNYELYNDNKYDFGSELLKKIAIEQNYKDSIIRILDNIPKYIIRSNNVLCKKK